VPVLMPDASENRESVMLFLSINWVNCSRIEFAGSKESTPFVQHPDFRFHHHIF
jgi:hypothetical protein